MYSRCDIVFSQHFPNNLNFQNPWQLPPHLLAWLASGINCGSKPKRTFRHGKESESGRSGDLSSGCSLETSKSVNVIKDDWFCLFMFSYCAAISNGWIAWSSLVDCLHRFGFDYIYYNHLKSTFPSGLCCQICQKPSALKGVLRWNHDPLGCQQRWQGVGGVKDFRFNKSIFSRPWGRMMYHDLTWNDAKRNSRCQESSWNCKCPQKLSWSMGDYRNHIWNHLIT